MGVETRFATQYALPPVHVSTSSPLLSAAGRSDRIAGLDLLRLVAAAAVVLFHFGFVGPSRGIMQTGFPALAPIAQYGFLGVELFFVISGFVIMRSASGRTWREFATARFFRLYPAHVVCMTATALIVAALGSAAQAPSAAQWIANLSMLAPAFGQPFMDGSYWSIVVEIMFYGWIALLLALGLLERRLLALVAAWLALAALNEYVLHIKVLRTALCTEFAPFFAGGMLIHHLMTAARRHQIAWGLLAIAFALASMHAFENQHAIARIYGVTLSLPILLGLHLAVWVSFLLALWASRWIPPVRTVTILGGLTYPLYLVHQHGGYVLIDTLAPVLGAVPALIATVTLAVAFAAVVYLLIEPPARSLLKALSSGFGAPSRPARADI